MAKKGNGEGSIQKYYKNGIFMGWRGRISTGYNENGRLIRKPFYGKTKQVVLEKMTEYKYKITTGTLSPDSGMTLEKWFHTWLFVFRINDLKSGSFTRYYGIFKHYVACTDIGRMKLTDLRPVHVQQHLTNLLKTGKTIHTIHTINRFLSTCLKEAQIQGYIVSNPCKSVRLPKIKAGERQIVAFAPEEQKTLIEALKGHEYETAILCALGTGLRLGELLALKWQNIDFDEKTLHVTGSIRWITDISDNGARQMKLVETTPKTDSSIRTVPIPEIILNRLKRHRKKQAEARLQKGPAYSDAGYIFCNDFGLPMDTKKIPRAFKAVLKESGIRDMKFHACRHTYATRLFEAGVSPKTVQVLMGHKKIETTLDIYTHVMPEQTSLAAEKINSLFG